MLDDGASRILFSTLGPSMRCRSVPWVLLFESGCPLATNLRDIEISSFAYAALPPLVERIDLPHRSRWLALDAVALDALTSTWSFTLVERIDLLEKQT